MKKQTLGGERLGSGNKMQVELHGFERSTHDLSYIWRSTMSAGTLVPFLKEVALPGDTFDINLNMDIKTHPTIGPLFGSYKAQIDVFQVPIRLYHSALHNNRLGIGMNMAQIKLPKLKLTSLGWNPAGGKELDNTQINPSCVLSYLGIRGVGQPFTFLNIERKFNAIPYLALLDIYKNYYANKQEEVGYVVRSLIDVFPTTVSEVEANGTDVPFSNAPSGYVPISPGQTLVIKWIPPNAQPEPKSIYINFWDRTDPICYEDLVDGWTLDVLTGTITGQYLGPQTNFIKNWQYADIQTWNNVPPHLESFPLSNIDEMRDKILQSPWNVEFDVKAANLTPYSWIMETYDVGDGEVAPTTQKNQEGLLIKTYQSDLFNNWLSTDWIDGAGGINEITAIDTSGGTINVDTIILARKVYDMLNRIAVSGGSYKDWLEAQYDHESYGAIESPVYMGGLIKELVFQEVVSNSATDADGGQPLGQLAGKGVMSKKHKGGHVVIKTNEPSYILGLVSLTPRLDYSQGNKWDVHLDTINDLHVPSLDQIGFQELITEQMAWWATNWDDLAGKWQQTSAGKQPAWINYMTNVNEVRGNFAVRANEMFMTLNRRYEAVKNSGIVSIKDLTTYIDPTLFNHIFAQTSLDAQNFWTQISVDMIARRKMSAKVMPNL